MTYSRGNIEPHSPTHGLRPVLESNELCRHKRLVRITISILKRPIHAAYYQTHFLLNSHHECQLCRRCRRIRGGSCRVVPENLISLW
jgi:hypothetical protein